MDKESLKDKKTRILREIGLKEINTAIEKVKKFLEDPAQIGDINLQKVEEIQKKLK